jgi:hypothetical protein
MTGEVGGIALGTAFVADIVASKRSSMFTKAVSDTWDSAAGFERNKTIAKETLGRFAFDAAAMTALGVGTAKVTERLMPKSVSVSEMLKNLTQKEGIKWQDGRPVPTTLANHFQSFPTKAKGYIETGKDAVVIELVDNTVLKILKTPLSPGSGTREFDLPILKHGTVAGGRFEYITQPKVPIVQDKAVANEFAQQVRLKGFNFWDREPSQLGIYKGKVKLVDYDAVAKMSVDPYA